jgi:hypothetical protein
MVVMVGVCKEELGTFNRPTWVHKGRKMLMKKIQELRKLARLL